MNSCANNARRDDVSRVNNSALSFIPGVTCPNIEKCERGWNNEITARLLCPQSQLDNFNRDWKKCVLYCVSTRCSCHIFVRFAEGIKSGSMALSEHNLPSFLWDQDAVVPEDPASGMFRGPVLLKVSHLARYTTA